MSAVVFVLLEIGIAIGVWRLADRARKQQLTARSAALFAGACAVLLLMLIATDWPLTDWPTPEINAFWDEHGVLSGTVQSVLLFGVGLLSYEAGQLRAQERLDESVTAAGLGGIVDHVVDVEVGLAFLSSPQPPDAHGWVWSPGKPLQWLRQGRDRLSRSAPDRTGDPRTWPATLPETDEPGWRKELVDQCIRRLLVVIRDWTPVIATSRNGTRVLVAVAELRKDLVELEATPGRRPPGGRADAGEPAVARPAAGVLPGAEERRRPAAPGGPRQLRPAAGDARLLGVGGRPVGARPVRSRVDQGPAGGDRGPQPGELTSAAATSASSEASWSRIEGSGSPAPSSPRAPERLLAERGPGLGQTGREVLLEGGTRPRRASVTPLRGREQPGCRGGLAPGGGEAGADAQALRHGQRLTEAVAQLERHAQPGGRPRQVAAQEGAPRQGDGRVARDRRQALAAMASASLAKAAAVSPSASSRAISARMPSVSAVRAEVALRADHAERGLVGPALAVQVAADRPSPSRAGRQRLAEPAGRGPAPRPRPAPASASAWPSASSPANISSAPRKVRAVAAASRSP